MTMLNSAVYEGRVEHVRGAPHAHRFGYNLHMLYLDLDELDSVLRSSWPLVREGRFGLLSFRRSDYLSNPASPLKREVLDLVEARLGARPAGPVRLLTQLRFLGYVFNPVSFYYCFARDGTTLDAVVAEITNTPWRERHRYVLASDRSGVRADFEKAFHISPFFGMDQRYLWTLGIPDRELSVTMVNQEEGNDVFRATLRLERHNLTATRLLLTMVRQPFLAWRIHAAIYWQAFLLWRKGVPFHVHPAKRAAAEARR